MSDRQRRTPPRIPPLSPVLFAGLALRPLPPGLLRPFLNAALATIRRRHPDVFRRLDMAEGTELLIDPIDLPFSFVLRRDAGSLKLTPVRDTDDVGRPTASIHGPLLVLVDLLEGRLDGDAVFFSRDLVIEGDTEEVVRLRNALDSGEINVKEDLLAVIGPLGRPARRVLDFFGAVFSQAARDLETVRAAFISPLARRCDRDAGELRELQRKATQPRRRRRGAKAGASRESETGAGSP